MRFSRRATVVAVAVALVSGACGAGTSGTPGGPNDSAAPVSDASEQPVPEAAAVVPATAVPPTTAPEPVVEAEPAFAAQVLPAVDVINLADGQVTNLADLAQPGPTLLWFWAPH